MKRIAVIILLFVVVLSACQYRRTPRDVLNAAHRLLTTNPDSAVRLLDTLDLSSASSSQLAQYALLLAIARERSGIADTNNSQIDIAVDFYHDCGDIDEVMSLYYKGIIQYNNRDLGHALIYLTQARDLATHIGDSVYVTKSNRALDGINSEHILTSTYSVILTDYLKSLSQYRSQSRQNAKKNNYIFISLLTLILVSIIIISIFYINKQRLNEIQRDSLVQDAQKLNKELRRDIIKDSSFIKLIDHLFALEECSPSSSEGDTHLRKKFRSILNDLKSETSLNDIEILADYYNDNLIKKLRGQVHNLSAKQISYICLFRLGFSNTSICCILNIKNLNALHQLRARIKNNIENSQASEKDLFISALKISK